MRRLLIFLSIGFAFGCAQKGSEDVLITWAVGRDPSGTHQRLIELFNSRHPDISIRLMEMPESSGAQHDAYVTYLFARDPSVDVYSLDIIWPAEFASAGWILPLEDRFSQEDRQQFLSGPIAGCTFQGKIYAVPWFTDAGLLYYRKDLLEEAGYGPPKTWREFIKQAQVLSKKHGLHGYVFQGQQYEGLVCNFMEHLWGNRGDVFDEQGKLSLDSKQAVEALQFMVDIVQKHKLTPAGVTTYKEEESRQIFTSGNAVFLRNWPYVWAISQDSEKGSKVEGKVGIAPIPGKEGGSAATLGGWNLAVSAFSRYPNEAWIFVEFLTSEEAQKVFALKGGRLPTRHSLYKDKDILAFAPHYADFYSVFVNARPRPSGPLYPQISDQIQIAVHKALTLESSPQEVLSEAVKEIRRILDQS